MGKAEQYAKSEKDCYGKIYVDINYALDNVSPFIDSKQLNNRKYSTRLPALKKYIELIDTVLREEAKQGLFGFLDDDKHIGMLKSYKNDNIEALNQLQKCSSCACLNCTAECKFDTCIGCKTGSRIAYCDHSEINVTVHDSFMLNLTNNNTGANDRYKVLATLQNAKLSRKYIILENIHNKEKFILYYYPGVSEDNYGEITDGNEFDFVVSTYESVKPLS